MSKMIHTHYDNLRIKRNATQGIIKAAYRALSVEYHPDKNPDRDTTRIMQMINDAYEVLSDPVAREKYDARVAAQESSQVNEPARQPEQNKQAREPARQSVNMNKPGQPVKLRPSKAVYLVFGALFALLFVLVGVAVALG